MDFKKTIRAILSNRQLTIGNQINQIKIHINPGEYKEALKAHPAYNKKLHTSPFFKSLNSIHQKEPYTFTKNFKKEYRWLANIVENYFTEINNFINLKNKFENYIILDDYKNANLILNNIEESFGISLWSIEANLIIEEKVYGSESNWNKLSYYLKEIKDPFYDFTTNSTSKRIESKLSYESYLNQFQNEIDTIDADDFIKDFIVFKNFNLAKYDYKYKNLESVLFVSNIFSIIDQYLILLDVILYNISISNDNDKLFFPFINAAKEKLFNDNRIYNIFNIINEKKELLKLENSTPILNCLNLYYSGNFSEALEASREGIKVSPLEYEFYEIYCKSLINLNLDFIPLSVSKTTDNILNNTFDLLTFQKSKEDSWKKLLKTSLELMNTNFGKQIFGLLNETEGKNKNNYIIGFLSSSCNSHKNLFLNNDRTSINENFKALLSNHSFKMQLFKQGSDINFEKDISSSEFQKTMITAIRFFRMSNFQDVIQILNNRQDIDHLSYYYERKINLLFYSFLNLKLLDEALVLFGQIFFDNSIITRKLNYVSLYEDIKATNKNDHIINLIEYPILYSLIVKEYDLYEAYDDFMCSANIDNLEELNISNFVKEYSLEKVIYFLNNVVTIDTIKYSTEYSSISDVEEDRIKILNILISIDSPNKLNYEKEINEIYRINSVRKVLKEVDEGRLYIDISNLIEIQIKNFKDDFKRFKEIEASSNLQNLIGFNTSNTKNWNKSFTEKTEISEKYNSADYLAFKSIYLESRDNFLFSKEYGLDSCLSTRIRHGALKNHIRSVFEKLNLVTSKFNDKYKENSIWKNQLIYYPALNNDVQIILKNFSKEIDDYTTFIVEKLIQIQTEKSIDKEDGVFKFFTNDQTLFTYYTQNKSSFETTDNIVEMLLTNLVNHTLFELLKQINDVFSITISNKFKDIIDKAMGNLRDLNLPSDCQLIPNLIKSSTEIQNELEEISNWFYLNTTSSSTLLSIETVIDASIELTNKINPNYRITPKINLKCEPFGVYCNLVFVFNILFNNIIQHSKLSADKIDITIDIDSLDEQYVKILISNKINKSIDYSKNIAKLNTIKQNWNNHNNIDRSNKEGESGFDKIKRILLYETFSKTDKFDFTIEKDKISIALFFPYIKYTRDE